MASKRVITVFVGRDVFLTDGSYVGEVSDLVLDLAGVRVSGLVIDEVQKETFRGDHTGKKLCVIPYESVDRIGDHVISTATPEDVTWREREETSGLLSTIRDVSSSVLGFGGERPDDEPAELPSVIPGPASTDDHAANTPEEKAPTADRGPEAGERSRSDERSGGSQQSERSREMTLPESVPGGPNLAVEYETLRPVSEIDSGGSATVYLASVGGADGVEVAVKEPKFDGTLHVETVERFREEAETWSKLDDHEGIVDVIDWGDAPIPWIAMEHMDGGSLADRLGEVGVREGVWIGVRVARALEHAHSRGVSHLDLKPGNVLFRETPGDAWDVPKVGDWGLSKHLLDDSSTDVGLSPQYAAPEQFDDSFGDPDHSTDVYQLGALLYATLTGRPPFAGSGSGGVARSVLNEAVTPPTQRNPELPEVLDDVLVRALETEKEDRYEHVLLLRKELEAVLSEKRHIN